MLYLNGESLVRRPLGQRRNLLLKHFKEIEGEFVRATSKDFTSLEDVSEFLDEAVKDSTEGLRTDIAMQSRVSDHHRNRKDHVLIRGVH